MCLKSVFKNIHKQPFLSADQSESSSAALYSAGSKAFSCWLAECCVEIGREGSDLAPCVERPLGAAGVADREQKEYNIFTL